MKKKMTQDEINTKTQHGFTLIETAIVIVILSFVITPLFKAMSSQRNQESKRQEELKDERAIAALAVFYKQNGRYPCPADSTLTPGEAEFGVEKGNLGNCFGQGTYMAIGGVGVIRGDLPVNTLGLPFDAAANIHGWKHLYAVTQDLTIVPAGGGALAIEVIDSAGIQIGANQHFVIVNHGIDGKGARSLYSGVANVACVQMVSTTSDNENCDADARYLDRDMARVSDSASLDYYDDVLSYTLAREQSTLWVATGDGAGGMDIINRNTGSVGIGTANPDDDAKMHVKGNIRVEDGDITATGIIRSPSFTYTETP